MHKASLCEVKLTRKKNSFQCRTEAGVRFLETRGRTKFEIEPLFTWYRVKQDLNFNAINMRENGPLIL